MTDTSLAALLPEYEKYLRRVFVRTLNMLWLLNEDFTEEERDALREQADVMSLDELAEAMTELVGGDE